MIIPREKYEDIIEANKKGKLNLHDQVVAVTYFDMKITVMMTMLVVIVMLVGKMAFDSCYDLWLYLNIYCRLKKRPGRGRRQKRRW